MDEMEQNQYCTTSVSEKCSEQCRPQFMKYQLIGGTISIMLWHADTMQRGEDQNGTYEINCCHSYWNTDQLLAHLRCNPTSIADRVILSVGYQESRNLASVSNHFLFAFHIKSVIQTLRENGCREMVLTNVPPCAAASRRIQHWKILKALNTTIQNLCEENDDLFLCNIFQLFCSPNDFKRRKEYVINGAPNYNVNMKLYNETSIHNPSNRDLVTFSDEGKKILWQHLKRTIEYRSRVRTTAVISDPLLLLNHIKFTQAMLKTRFPSEVEEEHKKIYKKPFRSELTKDPRPTKDLNERQPVSKLIKQVLHNGPEFISIFQTEMTEDAPKISANEAFSAPQIVVIGPEPSLISNTTDVDSSKASKQKTTIPDETIRTASTSPVLTSEFDQHLSKNKNLLVEYPKVPDPRSTSESVPSLSWNNRFKSTSNISTNTLLAGENDREKDEDDELLAKNYSVMPCVNSEKSIPTRKIYQTHNDVSSIETRHRNNYVHVQPFIEPMVQLDKIVLKPKKLQAGPMKKNLSALPVERTTSPSTELKMKSIIKKSKLNSNIARTFFLPKPIFQKDIYFRKLASNVDFKHMRAQKTHPIRSIKPSRANKDISEILNDLSKYEPNTIAYEISKSTFSSKIPISTTRRLKTHNESVEKSSSSSSNRKTALEHRNKEIRKKLRPQPEENKKKPARLHDKKIKCKIPVYEDPAFLSHEFFCGCKLCYEGHRQILRKLYKFVKMLKKSSN